MNSDNYVYVDIFDIPDVMKVRTKHKVTSGVASEFPRILYDGIVKLAEDIQQYVDHRVERDFGTDEYIITDTLFVIPPDCKRLAIPKPESEKENEWIPFSERMPEDGQAILLSGNKTVECVVWDDELKEWYRDFGEVSTAWMTLPKPYNPGVIV